MLPTGYNIPLGSLFDIPIKMNGVFQFHVGSLRYLSCNRFSLRNRATSLHYGSKDHAWLCFTMNCAKL